jgi:VIT1/CCC1 family predicted Fe2+/Mn2+ transporter
VWSVKTAFAVAEIVGVLALAVVGYGTAGGKGRSLGRRLLYIGALVWSAC